MNTPLPAAPGAPARLFHALSDETRLDILRQLAGGERCVCELTGALDAAQSRLSFHLRTLREVGLVRDRKEGRWVYYEINPDALTSVAAAVAGLMPHEDAVHAGEPGCCR